MKSSHLRSLCRVVMLVVLAGSACEKAGPTSPSSTPTASPAATRVVSLSGNLAFGPVEVGKASALTLTIANSGTGTLSVTGITCPAEYTPSWTHGTIAPGGSQQVTVRFAPTAAQRYDGALTVNGDHTGGANTAPLSGTGAPPTPAPPAPAPPTPAPPAPPAPAPPAPAPPAPAPPAPTPPPPTTSPTPFDDQILALINDHRRSIGKPALAKSQVIWEQANGHSRNMASGTVPFGHDGFEARIGVIRAALGSGGYAAENVAMGFNSAESVVNGWLNSAGHRANIEGNATRTGISSVKSNGGAWYFTQMFY